MTFVFQQWQVDELQARLDTASGTQNYTPVYDWVLSQISDNPESSNATPKVGVDKSVWLWVRGARQVNADDESYFSEFIREYTTEQYRMRYGTTAGLDIDQASNDIAARFASDILNIDGTNPNHQLPSLARIGQIDAGAIAAGIFDKHIVDGTGNFSPWAGTILFPFLGEGSFTRNWLLTDATSDFKKLSGTYDLISTAATAHTITNALEALLNSGAIAHIIADNEIGEAATLALLANLRSEANQFFQQSYGLPDEVRFRIGGDLPLYGVETSSPDYLNHPNFILGTLLNDTGEGGSIVTHDPGIGFGDGEDIVHGGLGHDRILGSLGDDLIDGGEGTDTLDYTGIDEMGVDRVEIARNILVTDASADDRMNFFTMELHGGQKWLQSESPWALGTGGVRYGRFSSGLGV